MILINPIIPHFAQYCWMTYIHPVLSKSQGFSEVCEDLNQMPWPQASAPYDKVTSERLAYLKDTKGAIRVGIEKAKAGGKKKPKKGEAAEAKVVEKCTVFVAKEYPEFQKQCLTILQGFEFDENNKIVGDHVKAIREAFPDKKQAGLAMKFVSFQLDIATNVGKEEALRLEASFDEKECIEQNKSFLFENLPGIKEVTVMINNGPEAEAVEGSAAAREGATPSKPGIFFH